MVCLGVERWLTKNGVLILLIDLNVRAPCTIASLPLTSRVGLVKGIS